MLTALGLLTAGAMVALHASELPTAVAWLASLLVLSCGVRLIRREMRRPASSWVFRADGTVLVNGAVAKEASVAWHGPLAFVTWRDADGRTGRFAWWPDTLPADKRRELRLAMPGPDHAGNRKSVAP